MKYKRGRAAQSGFTNLELVIFLLIIGILSGLIIATHKGIEEKQDNTERQRDVGELRVEMESYYSQYNQYPTLSEINNPTWRDTYMKGMNSQVMRDPTGTSYELVTKPAKNVYAYDVTSTSGKTCDDVKSICTQYTLTATLAGGGTYVKDSLE